MKEPSGSARLRLLELFFETEQLAINENHTLEKGRCVH